MPQPFLDIAFPGSVGRGATGGPGFSTQIVTLASGAEQRNVNWSQARGRWNISTGIRSRADMAAVIAHFHVVKGRAYSFRFKDWNDFDAADQAMMQITPTVWQIVKQEPLLSYQTFVLYYGFDQSVRQIAGALHVSEDAVKARLYRTRERIRAQWKGADEQ